MSTGLRFTLEVDGLPPDAFAVVSFHLTQSLSSLFSLDLSLVSQQFLSLEFAQVLDKMAYLTVWQGDDVQRRVKGVVTWFELGENDKNQMLYSMKVCKNWRAHRRGVLGVSGRDDFGQPGKSAAGGEGAARRDGPCAARPAAVHSLPHLQQLPDEDACTGGRFRPRLESAF